MNPALIGQQVKVYRNLHRDTWSLMAAAGPEKGRVIGYSDAVELADPILTVSAASRQRVLRERRRNVHAFVSGRVLPPGTLRRAALVRVRYNPFRAGCFTDPVGACVFGGGAAQLDEQGALWMDASPDATLLLASAEALLRQQAAKLGFSAAAVEDFIDRRRADGTLARLAESA